MTMKKFTLTARISSDNRKATKIALQELVSKESITSTDEGFLVKATMFGDSARELNRSLLSTLRRAERKTRLRSEWTCAKTTERFFDYVAKASRKG